METILISTKQSNGKYRHFGKKTGKLSVLLRLDVNVKTGASYFYLYCIFQYGICSDIQFPDH